MQLTFNPEYVPDAAELASMAGSIRHPGHQVEHRIFKAVVDNFFVDALNVDLSNTEKAVEALRQAQVARKIYQGAVDKINGYVNLHGQIVSSLQDTVPHDATEGLLQMDDIGNASLDDLPNLFGEPEEGLF